jgi:hypothetical protein
MSAFTKAMYKLKAKKRESCVIVPSDAIKEKAIKFLTANEYIIFDLDHIEKYIDWRDEPTAKYLDNRVELKKLIKKFKKYIFKDYSDEGCIVYISKNLDVIQTFNQNSIYVLIPSPVYNSIQSITRDEVYEVKALNIKLGKKLLPPKRKYLFKSDEEILDFLLKNLKRK